MPKSTIADEILSMANSYYQTMFSLLKNVSTKGNNPLPSQTFLILAYD